MTWYFSKMTGRIIIFDDLFAILAYARSGAVMHRFSNLALNSQPHEGPHAWAYSFELLRSHVWKL